MAVWQENKPAPTDIPNTELPSLITGNKTVFRTGAEKHMFWTDSSTNSIGVVRLSDGSAGPGAARAYYDVESNFSTPLTAPKPLSGRLFVTSNTTRFFGWFPFSSAQPSQSALGGSNAVTYLPSFSTIATDTYTLVQMGKAAGSAITVAFSTAYNLTPTIQLTILSDGTANPVNFGRIGLTSSSTTNFAFQLGAVYGSVSNFSVLWRSHGTVAL